MRKSENYRLWICGDGSLLVDYGQVRSVSAGVKAVMVKKLLMDTKTPGIMDMIPCNSSLLIQYDPRKIQVETLFWRVKRVVDKVEKHKKLQIPSRIIEIPVYFADPWTKAAIEEYCRNVKEKPYDVDFIIEQNGLKDLEELIHYITTPQYIVTYLSFGPGLPSCTCLDPKYALHVPKYNPPRTQTPPLAIGMGGSNISLYPLGSPGGYQMFGILAAPLLELTKKLKDFTKTPVLARVGDRFQFCSIDRAQYDQIKEQCAAGTWRYKITDSVFDLAEYRRTYGE
jgi:urea carboxylase